MPTDVRFVHITDGMEAASTDMTAARDYYRSLEGDFKLGSLFQRSSPQDFQTPYPARATVLGHGLSGVPVPAGTARRIDNTAGMIHQYTSLSAPDGATPNLLSYWVDADELQTTLAVGDATNPRIDLIEIKLDIEDESEARDFMDASGIVTTSSGVTRKRVRLTKNVVAGTPAANPAVPATTAGYAAWCYVWVPATHNAVFTELHVWDRRYPLGFDRLNVPASAMAAGSSGQWPITFVGGGPPPSPRRSGAIDEVLFAQVPSCDPGRRLLKAYVHCNTNVDVSLVLVTGGGVITTLVAQQTDTKELTIPLGTAANSATQPGAIWLHGKACAGPYVFGNPCDQVWLRIESRGSATDVYGASFEIAGSV
jgi:hypothetical protein